MSSSVFLSTFLLPSLAASTQQTPATGQQFIGPIPIINPSECTNAETFMLTISVNFSVFKKLGKHPALSTSANMHRRTGYPYDCYAWAQAGECDRNPSFMRDDKYCGIFCLNADTKEVRVFLHFFAEFARKSPKEKSNK